MRTKALIAVTCVAALPLWAAETDFRGLSMSERSALGREIRQVLRDDPTLTLPAFAPQPTAYRDEIDADHRMLEQLADQIFAVPLAGDGDAPRLSLVTAPGCPECEAQKELLTGWAANGRLRLYELPLNSPTAQALGLDIAPSFVFDTLIVRGDVPAVVLEKYLARQRD